MPSRLSLMLTTVLGLCLSLLPGTVLFAGTGDGKEAPAPSPEVAVLRSDARSVVFEYRPRFLAPEQITGQGQAFVRYDFAGSSPSQDSVRPGSPDLRSRRFAVSFPTEHANSIEVLAADYEDIPGVTLAPVPMMQEKGGMLEVSGYAPDAAAYAHAGMLPATVAALLPVSRIRGVFVGTIVLFPVQFNPAMRTVRRYSRVVVEVRYGAPASAKAVHPDAALFRGALLNGIVTPPAAALAAKLSSVTPSVLKTGQWYRIPVSENGVYKLDAAFLARAGINTGSIDPRTLRIYGNGGTELPEDITQPRPADLVENAIYVEGEADGKFDPGDYVLFYGRSARGWAYDAAARTLRHSLNHYTETNYYWLTFGGGQGKRMQVQQSETAPATIVPDRFRDALAVEEEKLKLTDVTSGKEWYAYMLDEKNHSFTYVNTLPGLVPGDAILYRYSLLSSSLGGATYTVREGNTIIGVNSLPAVYAFVRATGGVFEASGSSSLQGNSSQVSFDLNGSSGYIDWLEIHYPRFFFGNNNYLRFWGPDTNGVVEYQLQQFSAAPWVFNVSVPSAVTMIGGTAGATFRAVEHPGSRTEYVAAAPSAWRTPSGIESVQNQDLHGFDAGADFIVITSAEFRPAADRLAAYRESPAHGNLRTLVVDVTQIYNEFGGGLPDITAIRDYLKYAYDNWTKRPQFVLFFGGASYDYKGILGAKSSFVPTWQSAESRSDVDSYATDDYFVKFGNNDAPWMVTGRISSRTSTEANIVVDKLIRYDENSPRDNWRMRICFVADDAWTTEGGEIGDRTLHSDDAETLAEGGPTPRELERKKIYIAEYPTVTTVQGRTKPGAFQAIIDQINEGVLLLNYTGHGNPVQWAHENIFNVQTSIPLLTNANRLPVFVLATCNFSQYDDPKRYTGSELLMNKPDGGAVGVVSADRKVYASTNAQLNQGMYRDLFTRDAFGRVTVDRPATALFLYKVQGYNITNDQKYLYMGDPTMRLQFPSGYASIDSINGEPVDSVAGQPRKRPIQLRALSHVTVSGTIRDQNDQIDPAFNGRLSVTVNDATRTQTIVNFYPGVNWSYLATGGIIFRGDNSVSGGRFRSTFVVPKDISYADSTGRGRMVAYFYNDARDGQGYTENILVSGTDSTAVNDQKGPQLSLYLNSRSFHAGDMVNDHPTLIVDLSDSSGINTSGAGIGHRIEAWLNNSVQARDLTEEYTSKLDDYRQGSVQYPLTDLPSGHNTLRVRAWDSFNNSSTVETYFDVASDAALAINDVLNYPNPFASGTTFTFRQNQDGPLNVRIRIYTVAGRLIQTLETTTNGEPFVRIPWNGRDRDGDIIANGVYLYKVIVSTVDGRFTSEALGKLAVAK